MTDPTDYNSSVLKCGECAGCAVAAAEAKGRREAFAEAAEWHGEHVRSTPPGILQSRWLMHRDCREHFAAQIREVKNG